MAENQLTAVQLFHQAQLPESDGGAQVTLPELEDIHAAIEQSGICSDETQRLFQDMTALSQQPNGMSAQALENFTINIRPYDAPDEVETETGEIACRAVATMFTVGGAALVFSVFASPSTFKSVPYKGPILQYDLASDVIRGVGGLLMIMGGTFINAVADATYHPEAGPHYVLPLEVHVVSEDDAWGQAHAAMRMFGGITPGTAF